MTHSLGAVVQQTREQRKWKNHTGFQTEIFISTSKTKMKSSVFIPSKKCTSSLVVLVLEAEKNNRHTSFPSLTRLSDLCRPPPRNLTRRKRSVAERDLTQWEKASLHKYNIRSCNNEKPFLQIWKCVPSKNRNRVTYSLTWCFTKGYCVTADGEEKQTDLLTGQSKEQQKHCISYKRLLLS